MSVSGFENEGISTLRESPEEAAERLERMRELLDKRLDKLGTTSREQHPHAPGKGPPEDLDDSDVTRAVVRDSAASKRTATPVDAMRAEEVARTLMFSRILLAFIIVACIALGFMGGNAQAKQITVLGLVFSALILGRFLWVVRNENEYTPQRMALVAFFLLLGCYPGVYFWGIFSPAPAIIIMGLSFFSLGVSFRAALVTYLFSSFLQGGLALLILTGVLADRGLITAESVDISDAVVTQVLLQGLFFGAFAVARASRRATLGAVKRLEQAVREVAQREVLLLEAEHELDRAMKVGGAGRYTGQRVGSFQLGPIIGRGGMGEIYEGAHLEHGTPGAIKLLHSHILAQPHMVKLFLREAKAVSRLRSEHVVRVLEVGQAGQVPYIAMERLHGIDLAVYLRSHRRMALAQVIEMISQIGAGLTEARDAGIIHRDIKPQNLFLADMGGGRAVWKILDFGAAKLLEATMTVSKSEVIGTPAYMAPEHAVAGEVDYRSDLFSLGVIAYRVLTGSPPFFGQDIPTILHQLVHRMPKRPSSLVQMPTDIDLVLAIALAKPKEHRFDSGQEFARALEAASHSALDPRLRELAEALLHRHPWDTVR